MRVLVADDDPVSRRILEGLLPRFGCEVATVQDGAAAWAALGAPDAPSLALLDWMMPGIDGLELCRRLRARGGRRVYAILVTSRRTSEDVIAGLDAGADDFVAKPYNAAELAARLRVGQRLVETEDSLAARIDELAAALAHVKRLEGLLPICMHCKRIRSAPEKWDRLESYIQKHSDASFTHSVCETCLERFHPGQD